VLANLSGKGWTIVYSTHSPEMVSFDEKHAAQLVMERRLSGPISLHTAHLIKVVTDISGCSRAPELPSGAKLAHWPPH
jgi:hypothetical protein